MGVAARQPSADDDLPTLWIFTLPSDNSGPQGFFPHAVFSTARVAEAWIAAHRASGLLTEYPVDLAVYDWATERGHFKPQRDDQRSTPFIEPSATPARRIATSKTAATYTLTTTTY